MKIITIPHTTLRKTAEPVTTVDTKLKKFIADLEKTLSKTRNPQGVGLAAPQVDTLWRAFATYLPPADQPTDKPVLKTYINPQIIKTFGTQVLSADGNDAEPDLEGCLSMPGLYGPVPRWPKVEIAYQVIVDDTLVDQQETFEDFAARVMQHELDHLDGILFTDHSLEHDLPVYREAGKNSWQEIDRALVEVI